MTDDVDCDADNYHSTLLCCLLKWKLDQDETTTAAGKTTTSMTQEIPPKYAVVVCVPP
jgi:hypothetical protein